MGNINPMRDRRDDELADLLVEFLRQSGSPEQAPEGLEWIDDFG